MEMKKLLEQLRAKQTEMEKHLESLEKEEDEEQAKQLQEKFDTAASEVEKIRGKIENAKKTQVAKEYADQMDEDDMDGAKANPDEETPAAKAKKDSEQAKVKNDRVRDEIEKAKFLTRYIRHGGAAALQGNEMEAIRPTTDRAKYASDTSVTLRPLHVSLLTSQKAMSGEEIVKRVFEDEVSKATREDEAAKAMFASHTTGYNTDSGAGNLIPTQNLMPQMIEIPVDDPQYVDKVQMVPAAGGRWDFPRLDPSAGNYGGISFSYRSDESTELDDTQFYADTVSGQTYQLEGYVPLSNRLLMRSIIDIESYLVALLRVAMRRKWSYEIKLGKGSSSGAPTGILKASDTQMVPRQTAGQVEWADIVALNYKLSMALRRRSVFVMDDSVEQNLLNKTDANDIPLFAQDTASMIRPRLAGRDFYVDEFGPDLGDDESTGDLMFGDPRMYYFAVEQEITIDRSEHVRFLKDQTVFRIMSYIGGKPAVPSAFALLSDPA